MIKFAWNIEVYGDNITLRIFTSHPIHPALPDFAISTEKSLYAPVALLAPDLDFPLAGTGVDAALSVQLLK